MFDTISTSEQLSSSIMSELSRTRRRSEDEPTISSRQLQQTCARLLLQFESQIRAEYDKIMSEKLAGELQVSYRRLLLRDCVCLLVCLHAFLNHISMKTQELKIYPNQVKN